MHAASVPVDDQSCMEPYGAPAFVHDKGTRVRG